MENSNLLNVMTYTVDKTISIANSNSVVGERIVIDDITVIPVSKVSVGFAGGGTDTYNSSKKKSVHPAGSGAKVTLTPVTFLVCKDNEVKVMNIEAQQNPSAAETVTNAISKIKSLFKK